jgi:class 3 adenylate cyclase/predicted ATPase
MGQELAFSQAQLIEYARDLARVYAVQKRMAQYLPSGLRERISDGTKPVSGERRQVTVLCADLAHFTRLTSRLDPEDVFDLINACFRRLVSHIFKYGGMVDKFLGDGIMAVFGAPVAHEDDPLRAVQAALDMDVEMQDFSRRMYPQLGAPLQLHIGINCGEVIAGSVGVDEQLSYTVVGRTVNLAFRLQERAKPGEILVSQSVQQATHGHFKYRYVDAFEIKGFESREPVFVVENRHEVQPVPQPVVDVHLPWAGREVELEQLDALMTALMGGEGAVVSIQGDAGIGKTRLVREWLLRRTPPEVAVWTGTAHVAQSRIGYSLWRNIIQWTSPGVPEGGTTGVTDVASLPGRVTPLPAALTALVYSQPATVGAPHEAEDARVQVFQAIRQLLITESEKAPLVLAVDNWQWADDISRHLLLSVLPLADRHRILFCVLSRPAPAQSNDISRALEFQGIRNHHRIELRPLTPTSSQHLLASLFGANELHPDAQSIILGWMQGNPFFLKELILFLSAQGIIEPRGPHWRLTQMYPLSSLRFPPTLRGLTMANLDRLPEELQEVLHCAAVIGSTFSIALLHAVMAREHPTGPLGDRIEEIVRRGLIEPSTLDPDIYSFRHVIVQESIYDRLLSQQRQGLHRLIAEEMERMQEADPTVSVELIAYHFIQAGLPTRAVRYLIRSGQRAQGYAASKLAIEHYTVALVALEYAPRHQTERLDVEIGLADAYLQSRQYDEALSHYQSALDLCDNLEQRVRLYQTLSATYAAQNNLERAWENLESALEIMSEGEIPSTAVMRGRVFADCAQIEWRMGNRRRAELWAREAAAILEGTSEHTSLAASYQTLGQVYAMLGQHSLASSYNLRATAHLRATGRLHAEAAESVASG